MNSKEESRTEDEVHMRWRRGCAVVLGLLAVLALPALAEGLEPVATVQAGAAVTCGAFSPDGAYLALGCMNGTVKVFSTESWLIVWEKAVSNQGQISTIAFSPDGGTLGSNLASESAVLLLDARTGREIRRIELGGEFGDIEAMAFSPDGEILACADEHTAAGDIRVKLVDADTGGDLGTPIQLRKGGAYAPFDVAFSPDGRFLVGAGYGRLVVWDIEAEVETQHLEGQWFLPGALKEIAFSPDGTLLAAGGFGARVGRILLWDTETWQRSSLGAECPNTLSASVAFCPTGRLLACGYQDFMIWDVEARSLLWSESASRRGTTWVGFSPDGQLFAGVPYFGGTVTLWSVSDLVSE